MLRIHSFLPLSYSNGPGKRAVIWVQGCSLACPGCFNPETHSTEGGEQISVENLLERVYELRDSIDGISISGGEPLQQFKPMIRFLKGVRESTNLSTLMFTGFSWEEIERMPGSSELLRCLDVLIAGRFIQSDRVNNHLLSSSNQTLHLLSERHTMGEIAAVPPGEMIITVDGELILSGTDGIQWET